MPMQCFFPQNVIDGIKTPIFLLNAAYDVWQVIKSTSLPFLTSRKALHCCMILLMINANIINTHVV